MSIEIIETVIAYTSEEEREAMKPFLFPGFLTPLDTPDSLLDPKNRDLYALMAYQNGELIGLLICDFKEVVGTVTIKSLFAKPSPLKEEALNLMLKNLEEIARKRKIRKMFLNYPDSAPFTEEWDNLLTNQDWYGKRPAAIICEWEDCKTFHPTWFERPLTLPKGCKIVPWKRNPIDEQINSLGLEFQGEMVGWMETIRVNSETICYKNLFVDFALRYTGAAIALLAESIKLQQRSEIPRSIVLINYQQVKPRWIRFVQRRLVPYASKVTEYSNAVKIL